jgi:ComEC/Rec2-related protein
MISLKNAFLPLNFNLLLPLTLIFMGGIWWQAYLGNQIHPVAIGLILIAGIAGFKIQPPRALIFSVVSFCAGAFIYNYHCAQHLQFINTYHKKTVSCAGTITDMCSIDHPRFNYCITLTIDQLTTAPENPWQPCNKKIQIYTTKKQRLQVDDYIRLHNLTLKKPSNDSFNTYLIKEGIAATLFIPRIEYELIHRPTHSIARTFHSFKHTLFARLEEKIPDSTFPLFAALFLGNKTVSKNAHEEYPKDDFQIWGISHHLARSGLHMVIFIMLWELILSMLSCSFALKQCVLLCFACIYCVLSWSSVSFIRAFTTFLLYRVCVAFNVPINPLHILTIVCASVLAYNPMQLFFLDFQLSFGLTFALAWFNHVQFLLKKQPHKSIDS